MSRDFRVGDIVRHKEIAHSYERTVFGTDGAAFHVVGLDGSRVYFSEKSRPGYGSFTIRAYLEIDPFHLAIEEAIHGPA